PAQMAARYQPQRYVIGPTLYPTFIYVLRITWFWATAVSLVTGAVQIADHPSAQAAAERLVRESERLNPYAMSLPLVRAELYYCWRRYPEAVDLIRQVQKAEPENVNAYQLLARVRLEQHQPKEALEAGRAAAAKYPAALLYQSELAPYLLAAGQAEEARRLVAQVLRANGGGELNPYGLAMMYARMGDKEKTLDLLEQALEQHVPDLPSLRWEPALDLVRNDARYHAIVATIYGSAE
ncbi:MAG: hypothetical protein ABSF22_12030, partial [Bryobacteraceae bacterium]